MTAQPLRPRVVYQPGSAVFWVWVAALVVGAFPVLATVGPVFGEAVRVHVALEPLWLAFMVLLVWLMCLFDPFRAALRYPQMLLAGAALGATTAITLGSFGNEFLGQFWASILDPQILSAWAPALTAPFVEESAKLVCAAVILILCAPICTRISHALLVGMFVGFGFDIMEDLSYVAFGALESLDSDLAGASQSLFIRAATSVPSHWAFTALTTVGLLLLLPAFSNPGSWTRSRRLAVAAALLAAGPLMHFVWNSPTPDTPLVMLAKVVFNLGVLLTAVMLLLRQERRWVVAHSDKAIRAGYSPDLVASLPTWRGRRQLRQQGEHKEVRRLQRAALDAIQA